MGAAMNLAHAVNIGIHITAGVIAMAIGFSLMATAKGSGMHRKRGRIFVGLTLLVCASAAVGNLLFRFMPLFAVLTVLVTYQLLSGWHVVYTQARGPNALDAMLCAGAALCGVALIPLVLSRGAGDGGMSVVYSSLATLFCLIVYDLMRWRFPRRWHATLWRYEHIYKLLASLFAMLSAAAGNLLPYGQPWSQLLPSVLGLACIAWFFWREYNAARKVRRMALSAARGQHV